MNEIVLPFMAWAATHYRRADGEPTTEIHELKWSVRIVCELYGHTPAREFGPKALAAVREMMIERGWCRTLINRRVDRVKRVFRWAASQELVPVTVFQALRTLPGLQKGRTAARESERVTPADRAHVAATARFLTAHLRAMVELQLLTGMRPGEVCALTFADIDRGETVWVYRPGQHKTAHHGRERAVPLGPKARAVLLAFLGRDGSAPEGFLGANPNDPTERTVRRAMAGTRAGRSRLRTSGRPGPRPTTGPSPSRASGPGCRRSRARRCRSLSSCLPNPDGERAGSVTAVPGRGDCSDVAVCERPEIRPEAPGAPNTEPDGCPGYALRGGLGFSAVRTGVALARRSWFRYRAEPDRRSRRLVPARRAALTSARSGSGSRI